MSSRLTTITRQCLRCVLGKMQLVHSERWGDFFHCGNCGHEVKA